MKFPRIGFGFVTKPSFAWLKSNNKIYYLPSSKLIAKKFVSAIFACLGLGVLGCAILASGTCQTFLPFVALIFVAFCLFILAYYQYMKGWVGTQLSTPSRKTVVQVDWASFLSLMRSWNAVSSGVFCHSTKPVHICEGSLKILRALMKKRKGKNNGVFLIQEMDRKAIRNQCEEKETLAQQAFDLPSHIKNNLKQSMGNPVLTPPLSVPWGASYSTEALPESIICMDIPETSSLESSEAELDCYTNAYLQGFMLAIEKATVSPIVKSLGICILSPVLGVPQNLPQKEVRRLTLLSKMAFVQAVERLVSESVLPQEKASIPLSFVLTDPSCAFPLRSSMLKLDGFEAVNFSELELEEHFCRVM